MFIYETKVTARSSAQIIRSVCCEQCHVEYVFNVDHTAETSTSYLYGIGGHKARNRAKGTADSRVQVELRHKVRPVPCPACGWYQQEMVRELRRRMPPPLDIGTLPQIVIGICLLGLSILGIMVLSDKQPGQDREVNPNVTSGVVGVIGLSLLVLGLVQSIRRWKARNAYSPNDTLPQDVRVARGKQKAILLAEFNELYPKGKVVPFSA
jgi:hypothetical protein